ncbi:MAG: tannase/feruloyl esterase family alpha/beta hydrolase [Spongiibacteraceae bacterium]
MKMKLLCAAMLSASVTLLPACATRSNDKPAAAATAAQPAFSTDNTFQELTGDPQAKAVLEKHIPNIVNDSRMSMAASMSLKQIGQFPQAGIDDAKLKAIDVDLAALKPIDPATLPGMAGQCAKLKGWTQGDVVVESAQHLPAGTTVTFPLINRQMTAPAHCLLRGAIAKRTGVDGKPYQIGFELRLPDDWNHRFLYQGGGGYDGFIFPALGAMAGSGKTGLDRGFAVIATDAGHQYPGKPGTSGEFAKDPQAVTDFAYNALDRVTTTGKTLVKTYYGESIQHSYFAGCSGGGRQAMQISQKFPTYFDGVVAGAPASTIAWIGVGGLYRYQGITRANGDPAKLIDADDIKLISHAYVEKCDALDGQRDGLVFNFKQCKFKPATLLCKGKKTTGCLTQAKLDAFQYLVGAPMTSDGRKGYNAFPIDSGMAADAYLNTIVQGMPGTSYRDSMNEVQMTWFTPHTARDFMEVSIDEAVTRTAEMAAATHTVSTDLDAFRDNGKKIIYYHGLSDATISANDTIEYIDNLQKHYDGKTGDFARFFAVPGYFHCSGGPGLSEFDPITAIVDWVENGKAPDRLIAKNDKDLPGQTRPLCPYPSYAKYDGKGDPKLADSYSCAK